MSVRLVLALMVLAFCPLGAGRAHAQDAGRLGLTMGYPGSVGVIWHATDRLAIRPELNFSFSSTTSELETPLFGDDERSSDATTISLGGAVLFYLDSGDALRTYVSPRFLYNGGPAVDLIDAVDVDSSRWQLSGSFGAQYALGDRFAIFGETGVSVTRSTTTSELLTLRTETRTTGVRLHSGAGVILYF